MNQLNGFELLKDRVKHAEQALTDVKKKGSYGESERSNGINTRWTTSQKVKFGYV